MWLFQRLGLPLMLLSMSPLLILAACASPIPTAEIEPTQTDVGCTAFSRMTFDRLKDTDETITEVKAYDAARDAICGVGK